MSHPKEILNFWFGDDLQNPLQQSGKWWKKDPAFDREIKEKFEQDLQRAATGKLEAWKDTEENCLAFVILLDQFSRNIYRDTPKAFAQDPLALQASMEAIEKGLDQRIPLIPRTFLFLPLMHSEDVSMQRRCVELFANLLKDAPPNLKSVLQGNLDYARRHAAIIERFGRFPHRNKVLGRVSTPEEIEFLKQPGSSF